MQSFSSGLEGAVNDFLGRSVSASPEAVRDFVLQARQRDELYHQAASIDSSRTSSSTRTLPSTLLLESIHRYSAERLNIFSACILLSAQTEKIPSVAFEAFIRTAILVLDRLDKYSIEFVGREVATIARAIATTSCVLNKPKLGARSLRRIAEILSTAPRALTPVHTDFLQVCIKARLYAVAVAFIEDQDVLEVDGRSADLDIEDVLRYFYYAAICYISTKQHRRALAHFTTVCTIPALGLSAIVEESVKKARLLSLIAYGKAYELPKSASQVVQRFFYRREGPKSPYEMIVKTFVDKDYAALRTFITTHQGTFDHDNNLGLAWQVLDAWRYKKLRLLAQTFVTLTLEEVVQAISVETVTEAEKTLMIAVRDHGLIAHLDAVQGLVRFEDEPESEASSSSDRGDLQSRLFNRQLEVSMCELLALTEKVKAAQAEGLTSDHYIVKMTTSSGGGSGLGSGGRVGMSHSPVSSDIIDYS